MRAKKQRQINAIVEAPGEVQKGYLTSWLVICTFPHSDPKTPTFTRTNGDCTFTVKSGMDKDGVFIGLPYGPNVRLLSAWLATEAYTKKSRRLYLGDTIDGFIRAVGLDPETGNGKRGDMQRMRKQMPRFFRCIMSLERNQTTGTKRGVSWIDMQIAPKGEVWWDVKNPEQANLFDSWIELGEEFYNAIISSPVPVDFRALVALKHSPMAMDLYTWLAYRIHGMKDGGSVEIPLHGPKGLAAQIGGSYKRKDHFKEAVQDGLKDVELVWPKLAYDLTASHLIVSKCPVPIPDVPVKKKRRQLAGLKENEVSLEASFAFQKQYPNIKYLAVRKAFYAFLEREQIKPHDIDALFMDYATKYAKGQL